MLRPEPITAFVGVNGSGKTLSAVAWAIQDMERRQRPLITNVGGLVVEHIKIQGVEEVPDLLARNRTSNVLLDEAGAMFASRDTGRNKAFERVVQSLRHFDARLMWTAPAFARADKILREVTFLCVLCQPLMKRAVKDPETGHNKVWPSTRLILQKSFDVSRLDSSGMSVNRNAKAKRFGLVRTSKWEHAYDTFHMRKLQEQRLAEADASAAVDADRSVGIA